MEVSDTCFPTFAVGLTLAQCVCRPRLRYYTLPCARMDNVTQRKGPGGEDAEGTAHDGHSLTRSRSLTPRVVDRRPRSERHREYATIHLHVSSCALMFRPAMNVIRMIKLFGWEPRVAAQLSEKRAEELRLVKLNKILNLVNGLTK